MSHRLTTNEADYLAAAVHSERGYYAIRDAVEGILAGRAPALRTGARDHVADLANTLIEAWEAVEAPVTASYVASYADMARAAIAAGWTPPDGTKDTGFDVLVEAHGDLLVERIRLVTLARDWAAKCASPGSHTKCKSHVLARLLGLTDDVKD